MELELNHITTHFANGGRVRCLDDDNRWFDDEIKIIGKGYIETKEGLQIEFSEFGEKAFMVKRPLSDLTKPIKVEGYNDGKEFVPVEKLKELSDYSEYMESIEEDVYEMNTPCRWPYEIVMLLFEWHFPIDIPERSWIDINTL